MIKKELDFFRFFLCCTIVSMSAALIIYRIEMRDYSYKIALHAILVVLYFILGVQRLNILLENFEKEGDFHEKKF